MSGKKLKVKTMDLVEALSLISDILYSSSKELSSGLPGGTDEELGYDEMLVMDIADACKRWHGRQNYIKNPYVVWFFSEQSWAKVTEDMYQEDAYREWYRLTSGGERNNNRSCDSYYYLGLSNEDPTSRHPKDNDDDDDFSTSYLLNKSFG